FIDVTPLDEFVDANHQVFIVIAGIVILNDVSKALTIGRTAARIWIKHDITLRRHPLKFMIEHPSVSRVRPAVYVEDERILFMSIKIGWLLNPRVNFLAVKARVPQFFRLTEIQFRKQIVVDVR